jgi:transposase
MVKDRGYQGSADHFRAVVATLRPRRSAEAYQRLTTLPGEQAQVDWGHFGTLRVGRATRRLSAFVMVLSSSRMLFVRFYMQQTLSLFLEGHQAAFAFLGGVPRVVLYDNLKAVVLEREGDAIRFHPTLLAFAGHAGFEPRPVAVCRGNEKGRVERAIRYLRDAFFAAREVTDLAALNEQTLAFCQGAAAQRKHPEDRTWTVQAAWEAEKPRLLPMPLVPFPTQEVVTVHAGKTPYVRFDKNDYSVPHDRVARPLVVHATQDRVRIMDGTQAVAEHARSWDQGQQVEDPAHLRALTERKRQARLHRGLNYLTAQLPCAKEVLDQLAQRGENLGSATAALVRLLDHYGVAEMQLAIAEALSRSSAHPNTVRGVLERRRKEQHLPPPPEVGLPSDSPLRQVFVVPHALSTYDQLTKESSDDDIF